MNNMEHLFNQFLNCVTTLQEALNVSFGEALTETFDNLENGKIKVEMGAPDPQTVDQLSAMYKALNYDKISQKDKAQVFTYLTLKAINDDGRDANQMPTPQLISIVIALFMQKLLPNRQLTVMDPAIGAGNLLYSVISQLKAANHSKDLYQLYGIDNDEEMLDLADVAAHLNNLNIELYCQDAILPWMIEQPDVIISDLPVGFYPLDESVKHFATKSKTGHSFAHLLLTEQIIKNLKPGGMAFLVVPQSMLSGKTGADFMPWLANKVYLKAIVELPDKMFKNKFNQKSVLIFQNHGENATSDNVMLTKLEGNNEEEALFKLNVKLNEWYTKTND